MKKLKRIGRPSKLSTMSRKRFRQIRDQLELSQSQLARVLGYAHPIRISEMERETNPAPVPWLVAQLMEAMADGFRVRSFTSEKENNPFV